MSDRKRSPTRILPNEFHILLGYLLSDLGFHDGFNLCDIDVLRFAILSLMYGIPIDYIILTIVLS